VREGYYNDGKTADWTFDIDVSSGSATIVSTDAPAVGFKGDSGSFICAARLKSASVSIL